MRRGSSAELGCFSGGPVDCIALREELTSVLQAILERASSVKILDLSNNRLSALPEWIAQLEQLEGLRGKRIGQRYSVLVIKPRWSQ